jgi:hypothetical protein
MNPIKARNPKMDPPFIVIYKPNFATKLLAVRFRKFSSSNTGPWVGYPNCGTSLFQHFHQDK